jgi:hypothetical protein
MRTTATAIATRTAPRTSQRVRLQPARPCGCSRYVLIPLSTRLAPQRFHRAHFLMLFLHTRGGRRRAAEPAWDPRQNDLATWRLASGRPTDETVDLSKRAMDRPGICTTTKTGANAGSARQQRPQVFPGFPTTSATDSLRCSSRNRQILPRSQANSGIRSRCSSALTRTSSRSSGGSSAERRGRNSGGSGNMRSA